MWSNLSVDDKFCKNCGTSINSGDIQDNKNTNESTGYHENNNQVVQSDFNETFIKSYIGAKADKMYESVKKWWNNYLEYNFWNWLFCL